MAFVLLPVYALLIIAAIGFAVLIVVADLVDLIVRIKSLIVRIKLLLASRSRVREL